MNKELKEQAYKEFDEKFPSVESYSHRSGDYTEAPIPHIKSFIDSLIDKTVEYCRQNHRQNN